MTEQTSLAEDARDDLLDRGYSRRQLARVAEIFGSGAVAASLRRPAWASGGVPDPAPTAKVRIGANECWTGPLLPGQRAAQKIIANSNRYAPHELLFAAAGSGHGGPHVRACRAERGLARSAGPARAADRRVCA